MSCNNNYLTHNVKLGLSNVSHLGQQLFKKEKKIKNASSSKIYAQANIVVGSTALKKKMDVIK